MTTPNQPLTHEMLCAIQARTEGQLSGPRIIDLPEFDGAAFVVLDEDGLIDEGVFIPDAPG